VESPSRNDIVRGAHGASAVPVASVRDCSVSPMRERYVRHPSTLKSEKPTPPRTWVRQAAAHSIIGQDQTTRRTTGPRVHWKGLQLLGSLVWHVRSLASGVLCVCVKDDVNENRSKRTPRVLGTLSRARPQTMYLSACRVASIHVDVRAGDHGRRVRPLASSTRGSTRAIVATAGVGIPRRRFHVDREGFEWCRLRG